MQFERPLVKGTLIKRYKRFLADVTLEDGTVVTAHCPNTGSMKTCGDPGSTVYLHYDPNPKRKLAYTWELTETIGGFIGVNTARPNAIVKEAIAEGAIPELSGYAKIECEKKYGEGSRIDLLLTDPNRPPCFVEVKNTTLFASGKLTFPDAVTARGLKHLRELAAEVARGNRAVMFFLLNRPEGEAFAPADDIDPEYGRALREVHRDGVEILAYRAAHTVMGIEVIGKVAVDL